MTADAPAPGASLRELSPSQYQRLSQLLDETIDLSPAQRSEWLISLAQREAAWGAYLSNLFASQDGDEKKILETQSHLARRLASMTDDDASLVGKQFGAYRVLSLLGHGGMGSVWLAERVDGLFTRQVALKLVHPALVNRVVTERAVREREILASLNHPNIARLIDAGVSQEGQTYLALEYIPGVPLTTYCDQHGLSIRQRLELFLQVLSAVQYAHAHLVIHRDLKPSNVMVTETGRAYLLDFGIAKLLTDGEAKETELTRLGGRAMTADYAAPEQIAGAPITTAADVYALGVMLYEVLIGERPYRLKRDTRGALEEAILNADPVAPSRATVSDAAAGKRATTLRRLAKSFEGDLDTIVVKALKKSPAERYRTVDAFGEDIERYLRGDVVLAQRDSMAYRAVKFAGRYRVAIGAASVLILSLAGGLAATTFEAKQASRQRDEAIAAQLRLQTQSAAARLQQGEVPEALGIILQVLPSAANDHAYTPEALNVFQEARAADAEIMAVVAHSDEIRAIDFSPDGRRIITASFDGTAKVWDAASGVELLRLIGHTGHVNSAAFSQDGRRIVTGSADNTARIWDAATGRQLLQLTGHTRGVETAEFSPDGLRIVTAAIDKTARIWDAATGKQLRQFDGHSEALSSARFSPDGGRVLSVSDDLTARIWEVATGREIMVFKGHTDPLESGRFSPDGARIVTTSIDQTARIWEVATGRQMTVLRGHTGLLLSAVFSPDGKRVATASFDDTARIWDAATGVEEKRLDGHGRSLMGVAFSPDGSRIAAAMSYVFRVWDASPARELKRFESPVSVQQGVFSPDGARVLTVGDDKMGHIWEVATGKELTHLVGHTLRVNGAAFSSDGLRAATASADQTAGIWDARTGQELHSLKGHSAIVYSAAFSPDGSRVVTASQDKTARLWDSASGSEILQFSGHAGEVQNAAFAFDGSRIVTASYDHTARIWDAATGKQLAVLAHPGPLSAARFSPDGRQVVTGGSDARIFDVATATEVTRFLGHRNTIINVEFSADGLQILTASYDATARIWDAKTGRQLAVLAGHTSGVTWATFSPDGKSLLTTSADKTTRIWDADTPDIDTQLAWSAAAQFDVLGESDRFLLGLPESTDVRHWSSERTQCDELAAAPYDPQRRAVGVTSDELEATPALEACANPEKGSGRSDQARAVYHHGRASVAAQKFSDARRDFESAIGGGVWVARVDLARLLADPAAGMLDVPKAIALEEQAWHDGLTVAAFDLGVLYEHGVSSAAGVPPVLPVNATLAWIWYQRAADTGEPDALVRFAERQQAAASSEQDATISKSLQLEAFRYYADAAERARREDWPQDAWIVWRYRRASLARLLERRGMIREAAAAYNEVIKKNTAPATLWKRFTH
jgi:WD40 repeat protein/serine/threonine protein kinase